MICLKSAQAIVQDKNSTQEQEYFVGELIQSSTIEKSETFEREASIIGRSLGKQKFLALRQNTGENWDEKVIECRTFEETKWNKSYHSHENRDEIETD